MRWVTAIVGIVAVALAAATLQDVQFVGSDGDATSDGAGDGDGDGSITSSQPQDPGPVGEMPAVLEYLILALVAVVALVLAWYLLMHRRKLVELLAVALAVGLFVAVIVFVLWVGELPPPGQGGELEPMHNQTGLDDGGGGGGDQDIQTLPSSTILTALAIVAAIFVGAAVIARTAGSQTTAESTGVPSPSDSDDTAAVGAAAGRAADRIESEDTETTDLENEVYRAWREMTDHLDVDRPQSTTPGEFADTAIDAGLQADDVAELTDLFEDVRYGGLETTTEREARAITILRRIEAEYAGGIESDESPTAEHEGPHTDGENR